MAAARRKATGSGKRPAAGARRGKGKTDTRSAARGAARPAERATDRGAGRTAEHAGRVRDHWGKAADAGKGEAAGAARAAVVPPARRDEDRELGLLCAAVALERQAREVRLLFVGERLGIAEYFVLASVHNRRQARAVRDAARERLRAAGYGPPLASSEDPDGRWSLYDWGVVVLHLFDDEGRRHFDLDGLWADAEEVPLPAVTAAPASALAPGARPAAGA
ncbi:MAG TPA: ribosome silencing factor [Planctomycetota bacterium]|nr:ribosome silencing factor [Planctomycetota bacterium]